jgi:hypothetical protein
VGNDWVLWILVAASALHVVEEHALGWQGWATQAFTRIGVRPTWTDFWATNAALIVIGVAAAATGWRAPAFALALPAVCIINALLFHLLPSLTARRINPGCLTAVALYLPIAAWCYIEAGNAGVLGAGTLLGSIAIGALMMAAAIALLALGARRGYPDQQA